jgi:cytochrome c biogenesis protein CcmG, thiol:disulfide interchange protein DsbE
MRQALTLGLVLWALGAGPAHALHEGSAAPPLDAKLLDGGAFQLSRATGNVVIVNFWATWCAPCREEMPALDAYYRKHRAEGLQILAVSVDERANEAKVREVMQRFSFSAALIRDVNAQGYGRIWRIPLTFVIDRQGTLRKSDWYGDPLIDLRQLEKVVTPLLEAPAARTTAAHY